MNVYQKFASSFLFIFMASLSPNQAMGSEVLETEFHKYWITTNQQNTETLVKDALRIVNAKICLPVSLEFDRCRFEKSSPVIKLKICKRDDKQDQVGYLVCLFGDKESMNSYPNIDKMFPLAPKGNPTWAYLNYIEIYLGERKKGYSEQALNVFHCFVDILHSDFIFLQCDSHTPHAGHTYKKVGYEFHPTVLEAIKSWGMNKGIKNGQEEIEFLKDTSKKAVAGFIPLYMFQKRDKTE